MRNDTKNAALPKRVADPADEMAAFDGLPVTLRRKLASARLKLSAQDVKRLARQASVDYASRSIDHADRKGTASELRWNYPLGHPNLRYLK